MAAQIAVFLAALMQQIDLAPVVIEHRDAVEAMGSLGQQAHQRLADQRLAGSGFADDRQGLARLHRERDVVDHRPYRARQAKADRQTLDRQKRFACHGTPLLSPVQPPVEIERPRAGTQPRNRTQIESIIGGYNEARAGISGDSGANISCWARRAAVRIAS